MARTDPRNRSRFWQDPHLAGLSLLHADFTRHDYAPHTHDSLVVAVTEAGGAEFTSRGRTDEARAGRLLAFNPDEPHSGRMARSRRWLYRGLYLERPALAALGTALGIERLPRFQSNLFHDADLIAAFLALHRALDGGDPAVARERLVGSFGALFARHGHGPAVPDMPPDAALLRRIVERMREELAESLTLERLGAEAGLTPFQLIALFKRGTGLTPHAYLTQLRLRAAIRQMRRGVPIAEAAPAAGFYDQSALTRHFKRCYGITPLQYLRARGPAGEGSAAVNFHQ